MCRIFHLKKCRTVKGNLLKGSEDVQRRWAEYFSGLLNVEDVREASILTVEGERRMSVVGGMEL